MSCDFCGESCFPGNTLVLLLRWGPYQPGEEVTFCKTCTAEYLEELQEPGWCLYHNCAVGLHWQDGAAVYTCTKAPTIFRKDSMEWEEYKLEQVNCYTSWEGVAR